MWGLESRVRQLVCAGKAREAIQLIEQETGGADSPTPRHLRLLGMCYALNGELAEAEELFKKCISQRPKDVSALTGLGNVALLKGDPVRARDLYLEALRDNMLLLEPRFNLVLAYQDMGHFEKCLSAYQDFCVISSLHWWLRLLTILGVAFLLAYAVIS